MPQPPSLIDTHHHLWAEHGDVAAYQLDDYLEDISQAGGKVVASVYVECSSNYDLSLRPRLRSTGETRFAGDVGARCLQEGLPQVSAAIVAHADLADEADLPTVMAAHVEAGDGRLRGLRRSVAWGEDQRLNCPALERG